MLRGRCRHCGNAISIRYPLVELLTGVLFAAVGARFAHSWALPAFLVLTGALIAISAIDLEHFIIPNRIVYPVGFASVVLLALAALIEHDWGAFGRALLGARGRVRVLLRPAPRRRRGGMGFGDVRLSFVLGLFLGWLGWPEVLGGLFAGFLYGAVIGIALIAFGSRGRRQHIPVRPVPRGRHDDLRARRRASSSTGGAALGRLTSRRRPRRSGRTRRGSEVRRIVSRNGFSLMRDVDDCCSCNLRRQPEVTPWTGSTDSSRYAKSPTPCGCRP